MSLSNDKQYTVRTCIFVFKYGTGTPTGTGKCF